MTAALKEKFFSNNFDAYYTALFFAIQDQGLLIFSGVILV